jgi:dTDP-4-dehydrorhamnose reductase
MDTKAVRMKILLIGKDGQVGFALYKKLSTLGEVIATDRKTLDLLNLKVVEQFINRLRPDIIINAAAYTAVDKAESEPTLAHQINVLAPKVLAEKASELDIPLVHFSTNYVFDGLKKESYTEIDSIHPLSVYGKTKAEGDFMVKQHPKHIILRTGWVFGYHHHNFLKTVLNFLVERDQISIVNDQWGSPTSVCTLADVTYKILHKLLNDPTLKDYGTYHVTNDGETNWYDYALFIAKEAKALGFPIKTEFNAIKPILTSDYPTPASRPLNSRLNTDKLKKTFLLNVPYWQDEVKKVLSVHHIK